VKKITDFKVGDRASLKHLIIPEDTKAFVDLTGDDNPLHVDRAWAEKSSMKGIVTHGMLSASFLSTIIGKKLPGPGALWVSQAVEFLAPVRLGDELNVQATVTEVHTGQRLLKLQCEIENQRGKKVLAGECLVKLLEEPEDQTETVADAPKGVIVTGASRGIGAAIAKRLAADGWSVIVNYHNSADAAADVCAAIAEAGGKAWAVKADITDPAQVETLFAQADVQTGGLYGLVNNASGPIVERDAADVSWNDISAEIEAQVGGAYICIQKLLPLLRKDAGGAIVNIGSMVADQSPPAAWLPYNMAKAGMHALTRNLAVALGPKGVRINTVSPGMTETAMTAEVPEKTRLMTKMQTPLRRLAKPEDVAGAVAYLIGADAAHVTGETLRVNGGLIQL